MYSLPVFHSPLDLPESFRRREKQWGTVIFTKHPTLYKASESPLGLLKDFVFQIYSLCGLIRASKGLFWATLRYLRPWIFLGLGKTWGELTELHPYSIGQVFRFPFPISNFLYIYMWIYFVPRYRSYNTQHILLYFSTSY